MSVLTDLQTRLSGQGYGPTVVRGVTPDAPDELLTLQTYQGAQGNLPDPDGLPVDERLGAQAMSRAADQATAEANAWSAWRALHFRHATLNGNRYAWCRANQAPAYVGTDDRGRILVGFNLTIRRHRTS